MLTLRVEINRLTEWISDYVASSKAKGVAIGISGGIDSAVVAALCMRAIDVDHIHGLILPCESQPVDAQDGELVCDWLQIPRTTVKLDSVYNAFREELCYSANRLVLANIKARLRMTAIMALCNEKGYLNVGTTNKSELMIGYFTKYGDGGVDLEPISDFYKTEVFEIAKVLGVPKKILDRKPSAGLWEGQTDEEEIGIPYYLLDSTLSQLEDPSYKPVPDNGIEKKVLKMFQASKHKRCMPPSYKRSV